MALKKYLPNKDVSAVRDEIDYRRVDGVEEIKAKLEEQDLKAERNETCARDLAQYFRVESVENGVLEKMNCNLEKLTHFEFPAGRQ